MKVEGVVVIVDFVEHVASRLLRTDENVKPSAALLMLERSLGIGGNELAETRREAIFD